MKIKCFIVMIDSKDSEGQSVRRRYVKLVERSGISYLPLFVMGENREDLNIITEEKVGEIDWNTTEVHSKWD